MKPMRPMAPMKPMRPMAPMKPMRKGGGRGDDPCSVPGCLAPLSPAVVAFLGEVVAAGHIWSTVVSGPWQATVLLPAYVDRGGGDRRRLRVGLRRRLAELGFVPRPDGLAWVLTIGPGVSHAPQPGGAA